MPPPVQNPDLVKQMLLNGGVNPLYGSPAPAPDPSAPSPAPASAPVTQPSATPGPGAVASAMAPKPPMSAQEYEQSNPDAYKAFIGARPLPAFGDGPHAGLFRALASIGAGASEFAGEMQGHPGSGASMVNKWGEEDQAARAYDQNLPQLKAGALSQAYNQYITQQQKGAEIGQEQAGTAKTQQETKNLQTAPPGKEEFLQKFKGELMSGEEDPQAVLNGYLALSHSVPGVQRSDLVEIANQVKPKAPMFKIGPQGIREPIRYMGQNWTGDEPNAPPEVKQAAQNAKQVETQVHQNKLQEQAASRSNIAFSSEQGAKTKDLETGKTEATKALGDIHDATNQQQMIQDLLSGKMNPASQTAAMFKMIGLEQPTGTHRIMPAEVEGIEHLGGLSDRLKQKLLSWKEGDRFSPDLIPDVVSTAKILTQNKIKTANDSLESTHQIRGYKAPGSDEKGRFDSQSPAGGGGQQQAGGTPKLQVGQTVSVKGRQMKVTAVHPDGSFDAQ